MRTITFNELRKIKDSLPSGSMHRIADELNLNVDTVRNFFGGHNFKEGKSVGIQCATSSEAIISRKEKVSEYILSLVRMVDWL